MERDNEIALGIVILVILGGLIYFSADIRNIAQNNIGGKSSRTEEKLPLAILGEVISVDTAKLEIAVRVSPDGSTKIAVVSPSTKIEKTISQKNAKGVTEKEAIVPVGIGEVPKGSRVTVSYQSDKGGVLSGISRIVFSVDGNIDAYLKEIKGPSPYLKGQVVIADIEGKNLIYKPYVFDALGTTTRSVPIPDGILVYRVEDPSKVAIDYARASASLSDIKPGQTVFIMADAASLKKSKIVPLVFIISGK